MITAVGSVWSPLYLTACGVLYNGLLRSYKRRADHRVRVGTEKREKERADQAVCADHILEVC